MATVSCFIEKGFVLSRILLGVDSSLLAPSLSSSLPYTVIIKGEEIPLKCSIPEGSSTELSFFYCFDQSGMPIKHADLHKHTFILKTVDLYSNQTKIACTCAFLEPSGGNQFSLNSNQLVFSIIDVLPSPVLRVDLLSQKVKEGDPLLFLCSTEGGNPEKKFHFYKDGVEITSSEEGLLEPSSEPTNPLQHASLRILHATFNHTGEFACSYEENINGRWIMTSWSQGVKVTVWTQDSDTIWRYSWAAIPLIILLVPFAFYCWKKKSKSPSQGQSQKEERNDGVMEPQAARAAIPSPVKVPQMQEIECVNSARSFTKFPQNSEVAYSFIRDSFAPSPLGPTRKNRLTQREKEGILYNDVVFQPKRRQQSHL
ncbi:uncharacterized protein LOC117658570 [Pantherophis guttatus]|uniref:Uncharacterized protein LOC117658570 n=1 Tax=Pantherophis guttatus TaxID=94885 RepID=A0ABM3YXP8_PANGU|nr:uncharacterized protein LOC117658570 [Pantherophis guttatus]